MSCPYFEPLTVVTHGNSVNGRLPLIDEYKGRCLAPDSGGSPAMCLDACNHGYSRGICQRFPVTESRSALRYTVLRRTSDQLEILCIEEHDHAPGRHYPLRYAIAEATLSSNACEDSVRAQATAFCRSYLARFPLS
jgi:hypothetical protein